MRAALGGAHTSTVRGVLSLPERELIGDGQSPCFADISQTVRTISIIFCMHLLFWMRRDGTKFLFGPKSEKGFFRVARSQNYCYFYLQFDFSLIWKEFSE